MAEINNLISLIEPVLLCMLPICAYFVLFGKEMLYSIVFLAIFSLIASLLYLVLNAPDVAITESAIGACVSSVLLLISASKLGESKTGKLSISALIMVIILAIPLLYIMFAITGSHRELAHYYLEQSGAQIGIHGVVTSVLASYRGYDTLGETAVIATAALGVYLLLANKTEES